jgi:hypothetical protein
MRRTWLPPVAAIATGAMFWTAGRIPAAAAALPLVMPGLWLAVWLLGQRPVLVVTLAAAGVLVGVAGLPPLPAVVFATFVAAGIAGGAAYERGKSTLAVIVLIAAVMVPGQLLAWFEVPASEQFAAYSAVMREYNAGTIPADATDAQRLAATAEFERQLERAMKVSAQVWPSVLALGLLAQAALGLGLGRWLARLGGRRLVRPPGRPFAQWEAPGAMVWILAAGLVGLLVGRGTGRLAGLNLAILAAIAYSVQGVAVQMWVSLRFMSPAARTAYWLLTAFFLAPVVVTAGAFIGLMDQWWDLRKLHRRPEQAEEGGSPWK